MVAITTMNDMVWGKRHFLTVIRMKDGMRTGKDMAMGLTVFEILPDMLENILKDEDTDMAHFGIQVRPILYAWSTRVLCINNSTILVNNHAAEANSSAT